MPTYHPHVKFSPYNAIVQITITKASQSILRGKKEKHEKLKLHIFGGFSLNFCKYFQPKTIQITLIFKRS